MQNPIAVNEIYMGCAAILPLHPRLGRLLNNVLIVAAYGGRGREESSWMSDNIVQH